MWNKLLNIDLFTDSDAILNFSPVNFCVKWTLYFVSTSNIMEEFQFSRSFDFRKLCNMSVEVYVFMKALTMKNSHIPCGEWEFYNIGQNPSSNIFMKVPLCTSVASVFIELQNLFSSENDRTRLIFTRPRVVLTLKMAVDLLESKLYMWKFVLLHNFGWGIRIYFHFSTKVNRYFSNYYGDNTIAK